MRFFECADAVARHQLVARPTSGLWGGCPGGMHRSCKDSSIASTGKTLPRASRLATSPTSSCDQVPSETRSASTALKIQASCGGEDVGLFAGVDSARVGRDLAEVRSVAAKALRAEVIGDALACEGVQALPSAARPETSRSRMRMVKRLPARAPRGSFFAWGWASRTS